MPRSGSCAGSAGRERRAVLGAERQLPLLEAAAGDVGFDDGHGPPRCGSAAPAPGGGAPWCNSRSPRGQAPARQPVHRRKPLCEQKRRAPSGRSRSCPWRAGPPAARPPLLCGASSAAGNRVSCRERTRLTVWDLRVGRGIAAAEALVLKRCGASVTTIDADEATAAVMGTNLMDPRPRDAVEEAAGGRSREGVGDRPGRRGPRSRTCENRARCR